MIEQLVNRSDLGNFTVEKPFNMIDNYVYLYHTKTLIVLPVYPDSIQDSMPVSYQQTPIMSRSAPIFSYSSSGPRSMQIELPLHRDMMNEINVNTTRFQNMLDTLSSDDYVDIIVKQLQAAALPRYGASEKMIDPPLIAIRFGNSIFCKGVVDGGVSVTYSGPILTTDKYALTTVAFTILEVDPYDAEAVMIDGGFRGIRTSLESKVFKSASRVDRSGRGPTRII